MGVLDAAPQRVRAPALVRERQREPQLNDEQREFEERLEAARRDEGEAPDGAPVIWRPQAGSQTAFLACPAFEALIHGTRGGGKTDALVMDFAQHVGRYGEAWRGILFRETYPQLADVVAKTEKWFRRIFPGAQFNVQKMQWRWESGEVLMLRHMRRPADYWSYHGHELPWIGWEELTNWADDRCYKAMISCCRSSTPGVPRKIRATTNPYGKGTNWVKGRFQLAGQWWKTVVQRDPTGADGKGEPPRVAIHSHVDENLALLAADPDYKRTIATSATNAAMSAAWLEGSWDIVAGGMFDDVWSPAHNDVPRFQVPHSWRIDRAFDWGSSAPFSVGWYAQSDGSDLRLGDGRLVSTVCGDLFRFREWYGWTGRPNEGLRMLAADIATGIVEREIGWGLHGRVKSGPADSAIFKVENGMSVAQDMTKPVRIGGKVFPGVEWTPADKSPGSRKMGWERMRQMVRDAKPAGRLPRERPGLFVVGEDCPQFLRTVLAAPRDERDPDDVDTDSEDHIPDEVRYRCRAVGATFTSSRTTGMV